MKNLIAEITKEIAKIKKCKFASLTYLTKKNGELARYTVNLGFSYISLVEKSIVELEILIGENKETWNDLQKLASSEIMDSLKETIQKHSIGEQNSRYTKAGQYIPIRSGLSLNSNDNTIQLFGLLQSKTTILEGTFKKVNSSPLTIEKNKIRKLLSVSKFREFAIDESQIESVKVNGETFEM